MFKVIQRNCTGRSYNSVKNSFCFEIKIISGPNFFLYLLTLKYKRDIEKIDTQLLTFRGCVPIKKHNLFIFLVHSLYIRHFYRTKYCNYFLRLNQFMKIFLYKIMEERFLWFIFLKFQKVCYKSIFKSFTKIYLSFLQNKTQNIYTNQFIFLTLLSFFFV